MSPPSFVRCTTCHKEFGSRSINIHAPKCAAKHSLFHPLQKGGTSISSSHGLREPIMLSNSASDDNLNNSWPNALLPTTQRHRPRSASHPRTSRECRPSTATLPQPQVLDVSLKDTIDMSEMTRDMAQRLLPRPEIAGSSDYSSDFTCSTSDCSLSSATPCDNDGGSSDSDAGVTTTKIAEPCQTCGKEQNPERFHTHPELLNTFANKEPSESKKPKTKSLAKTAVTKPTALKFRSRDLERAAKHSLRVQAKVSSARPPKIFQDNKKRLRKPRKKATENTSEKSKEVIPIKDFIEQKRKEAPKRREPLVQIVHTNEEPRKKKREHREKDFERKIRAMSDLEGGTRQLSLSGNSRPTRVCYICGREFGSKSLSIHEPKCLEKWNRENEKLPASKRREQPVKPDEDASKDQWNDLAWKSSQSQLIPCENCGRTFLPDRLEVHLRGCKSQATNRSQASSKSDSSPSEKSSPAAPMQRPTVVCYICGREFGSKSITIHEPQCLIKWNKENDKLAEHLKREQPTKPELQLNESGEIDRDAMAAAAWKSHLDTLVKCEGCARTFFPDRLTVHQKSCLKSDVYN